MVDRSLLRQSLQRHVLSIDSLSTDSRREPDPEPESGASSVHTSASPASSRSSKGALDVTLLSLAGTSYYISSFANTLAATAGVGTVRVLVPSYSPETETLDRDRVDLIEFGVADSVARSMLAAANPWFPFDRLPVAGHQSLVERTDNRSRRPLDLRRIRGSCATNTDRWIPS